MTTYKSLEKQFDLLLLSSIREILPPAFQDLHSLEWIKIANNDLKTLHYELMEPVLDSLMHIDLHSESVFWQNRVPKAQYFLSFATLSIPSLRQSIDLRLRASMVPAVDRPGVERD